ncbi:MAG: hypothetical protein KG029_05540 [Bacteroidetes bacterium]|jgi:hypothetical protein|nr:hypothetical protein [Bacteroidota bacterium]
MTLICDRQTCLVVASGKLARQTATKQQYLLLRPLFDQLPPEAKRQMKLMIKMKTLKLLDLTMAFLMLPPEPLRASLSVTDYYALYHATTYRTKLLCSNQWYQTVSQHLPQHDRNGFQVYEESMMVCEPPVFGTPTVSPAHASVVLIMLNFSKKQHEKQSKNKK